MESIDSRIRRNGYFLRRRDLLRRGYSDAGIRRALEEHRIFRVRHGWYSVPDAPPAAIRAVRVGGRLTSISALESYGLRVPRRPEMHIAVLATASRLRRPDNRRRKLAPGDRVRVHWIDRSSTGGNVWRVSIDDALLAVLLEEPREIAVASCSAVLRHRKMSSARIDAIFRRAPKRVQAWRSQVSALDDSHGETFVRLWFADAGLSCVQQPFVPGVGQLDFRVAPHVYVEIDGAQHDPAWTGGGESSYERDHDRDTTMTIGGDRVLRYTYRQIYGDWPRVLAAIERAIADDAALTARRLRHPYRPRVHRKRRRS
jgi:very-short-patch-repair endonuclease